MDPEEGEQGPGPLSSPPPGKLQIATIGLLKFFKCLPKYMFAGTQNEKGTMEIKIVDKDQLPSISVFMQVLRN